MIRYNITLSQSEYETLRDSAKSVGVPMSKIIKQFINSLKNAGACQNVENAYLLCLTSNGASGENLFNRLEPLDNLRSGDFSVEKVSSAIDGKDTVKCSIHLETESSIVF